MNREEHETELAASHARDQAEENYELLARFLAKVDKTDGCWNWTGCTNHSGYGQITVNGKGIKAHRLSWAIHNGELPEGNHHGTMCVLHHCDNPSCVNPSHLFLGTHKDNMVDMISKGRGLKPSFPGSSNPMAQLDNEKVRDIRASYPSKSQRQLAKMYGVAVMTINRVVNNKSWRQVS